MNRTAFRTALIATTVLQAAMVLAGHVNDPVKAQFALLGTGLSLLGGIAWTVLGKPDWKGAAIGGAVVGGLSALLGIIISWALGVVEPIILLIGTSSSLAAGIVGAAAARLFVRP
jgi:hypothetical protein